MHLLERARQGDEAAFAALERRYTPLMRALARNYYAGGMDRDDFQQEARIGLWKAVQDYDGDISSFGNFAHLCVTRQLITALKTAQRGKHSPLNDARSYDEPTVVRGHGDGWFAPLSEVLASRDLSPADAISLRDAVEEALLSVAMELTLLERAAFEIVALNLGSYEHVAAETGAPNKAVDNALQRARRKLSQRSGSVLMACP